MRKSCNSCGGGSVTLHVYSFPRIYTTVSHVVYHPKMYILPMAQASIYVTFREQQSVLLSSYKRGRVIHPRGSDSPSRTQRSAPCDATQCACFNQDILLALLIIKTRSVAKVCVIYPTRERGLAAPSLGHTSGVRCGAAVPKSRG